MRPYLVRAFLLLVLLISTPAFAGLPPLGFQDEGSTEEKPVFTINCVGAGISCAKSGTTGTITVGGGGGASIVVEEGNATVDASVTNLDFLGADFDVTSAPAGEANVVVAAALTRDAEWDTIGEIETVLSANVLLETEIDASSELLALMDDETGTGLLTFATNPLFTGARFGNGATTGGFLDLVEDTDNGTNRIRFTAPAAITSDQECVLEDDGNPIPDSCVGDGTDGGGGVFFEDSATTGNVVYVGCSDSIADAITAATAGDTLQLGACTYSLSAELAINKALILSGIKGSTVLDWGSTSESQLIEITADNVTVKDLKLTATDNNMGILVNGVGGTVFSNVNIHNVDAVVSNSGHAISAAFRYEDAGGIISGCSIISTVAAQIGEQHQNIFKKIVSTAEADTTLYISNVYIRSTNTNASFTGQHRGIMNWNNAADESTQSAYVYIYNTDVKLIPGSASSAEDTEAFQAQGNRVYTYAYNSSFDGSTDFTSGSSTAPEDIRCDDNAICTLSGVTFGRGLITNSGGGSNVINGLYYANGLIGSSSPTQAPAHLSARPILSLVGSQGGDKPGTGSTTGLVGGGVSLTGGAGGAATAATVTGTAGAGAAITLATGAGGAQTTATSTTNVGGAGGTFTLYSGDGGVGNSAATTNTGGDGGDFYIYGGLGGVGTTTSGSNGDLIIGRTAAGVERGNVGINTLTPVSKLDIADSSGSAGPTLTLKNTDTTISSSDVMGYLDFYGDDANLTTQKVYGRIHAVANGTTTTDQATGTILMSVVLASAGSPTELLRLSNTGLTLNEQSQNGLVPLRVEGDTDANLIYTDGTNNRVGIGNASPSVKLDVTGAITSSGIITSNANLDVKNGATTSGVLAIYEDSDAGTNKATFQVPSLTADTVYVLPADDGDATEQLTTDGAGNLTWEAAGSGSGAPTDADYLVGTANGSLSAEIVVGTSPGGELGGTWASPTIDDSLTVTGWVLGTFSGTTGTVGTMNIDLLDGVGAVDMDYGSADITDHTFTTDGTGTAEIVLPAGAIDSTEILDDTILEADLKAVDAASDEECLTYETTTGDFEWQTCGSGSDTNAEKEYVWPASATLPLEAADSIPPIGKDAGTNIDQLYVAFDSAADECRSVNFKVPSDVTSGTVTFKVNWYSAAATSGAAAWDFRHNGGVTTGTDPDQSLTLEFIESDTTAGTAGQLNIASGTETIANLGWSANEQVDGVFCRDGNGTNGTDDLTGDALAVQFSIQIPRA